MRHLTWILLALIPCAAIAGDNPRDHVEASTVITGWVEVAPDGSVYNYTLDQPEKLDTGVVGLIAKTITTWKFKPVLIDGKPVVAKARMNLRVVASPTGKGEYDIRVRGVTFGDGQPAAQPSYKDTKPPVYPMVAIRARTEGTVYLALEIDRAGHVIQAAAEQVNLRAIGTAYEMKVLRNTFADASLAAAKGWTFNIPTTGTRASDDHWTVMVPVNFELSAWGHKPQERKYGQWDVYVPGPVQPIPWEQDKTASDTDADAVPDGLAFLHDTRFVLLTPPQG